VVELEIGEDRRHFEGVGKIRVAGGASLFAMRLHGVDVGAIEHCLAGIRIVALDAFDQVILPHHSRRQRLLCSYRVFKYLRDNVKAALQRRPRPGLARQVGGRTRHRYPCRRRPIIGRHHTPRISSRFLTATRRALFDGYRENKRPGRSRAAQTTSRRPSLHSSSSGCSSGGVSPSRPLSSSSSVIRSTVTSVSSASTVPPAAVISGAASGSGSSTSTYFCREWTSSSLRSSGDIVFSAISRSATTGFLSLSRSTVI